ncbi:MAG: type III pantothenate kinase [Pseudomonadales bacterium]
MLDWLMMLEIDVGNSRVKWRVIEGGAILRASTCSHDEMANSTVALHKEFAVVDRVRVASVADSLRSALQALAKKANVPIEFAQSVSNCAGVTNSYDRPQMLGVDRWLAMLAAFNCEVRVGAAVVIDSGTSLTIDVVAETGIHMGGLILPGKQLLLESLTRNTEKVLFDPELGDAALSLGRSTQTAVLNGSLHMLVGAIHQAIQSAGLDSSQATYFLSGGDAQLLRPYLDIETLVVPDLVLDGLRYSLP